MINALNAAQRRQAILSTPESGANNLAEGWQDNLVVDYAGLNVTALTPAQQGLPLDLFGEHVSNMREGHAQVRMDEVRRHLARSSIIRGPSVCPATGKCRPAITSTASCELPTATTMARIC
jgi:hypothetical protein